MELLSTCQKDQVLDVLALVARNFNFWSKCLQPDGVAVNLPKGSSFGCIISVSQLLIILFISSTCLVQLPATVAMSRVPVRRSDREQRA
ncbi:hypothetical protein MA16_Dca001941 [Dendrobium catenatum]|uniref:Uncharacterized protein n=1 Tax=Dendrobium catenatum TaxID=906689 RepID=A0A2I0XDY6_9ASPA|nr:hypothetical protein MA16_Dca001941 [Dendrobium catenatum]